MLEREEACDEHTRRHALSTLMKRHALSSLKRHALNTLMRVKRHVLSTLMPCAEHTHRHPRCTIIPVRCWFIQGRFQHRILNRSNNIKRKYVESRPDPGLGFQLNVIKNVLSWKVVPSSLKNGRGGEPEQVIPRCRTRTDQLQCFKPRIRPRLSPTCHIRSTADMTTV